MNLISLVSTIAMAVGLAASLPQIARMLRTRSSGGQSVLGWGMGLATNLSMAYVNLIGFGAVALMASNLVNAVLCVAAIALITRFNAAPADHPGQTDLVELPPLPYVYATIDPLAHVSARAADHAVLADMPTTEFVALREAVDAASSHRERRAAGAETLAYAA